MAKLNSVNNHVLRLAPGFRFQPTDEELVLYYLMRKVQSLPLPPSVIPEADVCKSDPWDLPGDVRQERYFFATMEIKYPNGKRSNRATTSGYWKATGLDRQIMDFSTKHVVGIKKTLVFYLGKRPNGSRSNWIMHEYKLFNPTPEMAKWVICRMFQKRRPKNEEDQEREEPVKTTEPVVHDFMGGHGQRPRHKFDLNLDYVSSLSSSGSSGVTQVADQEVSSKY